MDFDWDVLVWEDTTDWCTRMEGLVWEDGRTGVGGWKNWCGRMEGLVWDDRTVWCGMMGRSGAGDGTN